MSQLKGQVDGARADWPGAMADSARDGQQLAGIKFERSALEVDGEAAFDDEECLVGVWMEMPVVGLGHRGYANDVVVDVGDWMVVISRVRRFCF